MKRFLLTLICTLLFVPSVHANVEVGKEAPDFSLMSESGQKVSLSDYKGKYVVLEWFNRSCPYVKKHYKSNNLPDLQKAAKEKGVVWLTIDSTNPDHKSFIQPDQRKEVLKKINLSSTAYLSDPNGKVGKLFGAKTTPHMFVVDDAGKVAYAGAIDSDDGVFADPKEADNYVSKALDDIIAGKPVAKSKTPPYGCSVKYAD